MTSDEWREETRKFFSNSLIHAHVPNGTASIGGSAFRAIGGLLSIQLPSSLRTIGNYAFANCTGLYDITIPQGVTSIGQYAFSECINLHTIVIPSSVTYIGDYAFSMGNNQNVGLSSITLNEGLVSIAQYAFVRNNFTNIVIPDSVTTIGASALSFCKKLDSITMGTGVSVLSSMLFRESKTPTYLIMKRTSPPSFQSSASDTFYRIGYPAHVYVPSGSVEAYKTHSQWSVMANNIEANPNE